MRKLHNYAVRQRLRECSLSFCFHLSDTFFCPSWSALSLAAMARSIPQHQTRPTGSYNDPFGDGAYDEPFSMGNLNHDDTKTFATYTSGITARDPTRLDPLAGPTQAESLAADYRQHDASPLFSEIPDRLPTPSLRDSTLPNPSDTTMNAPYRDDDSSSSPRHLSVVGKSDAPLVYNAADMGRSSGYQDLGMQLIAVAYTKLNSNIAQNTRNPHETTHSCQKRGPLSKPS